MRPFPGLGGVQKISTNGGRGPVWISDRELAYRHMGTNMMEVVVLELGTRVQIRDRRDLFDLSPYNLGAGQWVHYDISWDGQEFVMASGDEGEDQPAPVVVLNWFEEIRQRAAEQGGG